MLVPVLLSPAISIDINNVVQYLWKNVQSKYRRSMNIHTKEEEANDCINNPRYRTPLPCFGIVALIPDMSSTDEPFSNRYVCVHTNQLHYAFK